LNLIRPLNFNYLLKFKKINSNFFKGIILAIFLPYKNKLTIMKNILLFFTLFIAFNIQSQTVANQAELNEAIDNAIPGTVITLQNGAWQDVNLSINKVGTEKQPIIIKAEVAGKVFFEGNSHVKLGGSYIHFEGVIFQNPNGLDGITPVVEFKSGSSKCDYCKMTNIKIDSYNADESKAQYIFKWVIIQGQHNEISYCSFIGKHGVGSIINDNRSTPEPDYSKIHHNYFADRTPVGIVDELNDQDAIRIGNSKTSLQDSFTEVYDNLFYNFEGEIEVISNKSCHNKYYNNTFRDYHGCLTLRHGNDCEVFNNFFIANQKEFSGGIRVMGENHKVYNNYIEGVNSTKANGKTSKALGGINVTNGRENTALNGYYQVKNATIVNNTIVDCDYGIRVGTSVSKDLFVAPENVIIANNILFNNTKKAIGVVTPPTGNSPVFTSNIKHNGEWNITEDNNNKSISNNLLDRVKPFYRLSKKSVAIDAGSKDFLFVTKDITNGIRDPKTDIGAEEFNSNGTHMPYEPKDVGTKIGFSSSTLAIIADNTPKPVISNVNKVDNININKDKSPTAKAEVNQNSYKNTTPVEVPSTETLVLNTLYSDQNFLTVYLGGKTLGLIQVLDTDENLLLEENVNDTNAKINITNLKKGIYMIKVQGIKMLFIKLK
jgi:poly(beta-D-mannuronate) lyase